MSEIAGHVINKYNIKRTQRKVDVFTRYNDRAGCFSGPDTRKSRKLIKDRLQYKTSLTLNLGCMQPSRSQSMHEETIL